MLKTPATPRGHKVEGQKKRKEKEITCLVVRGTFQMERKGQKLKKNKKQKQNKTRSSRKRTKKKKTVGTSPQRPRFFGHQERPGAFQMCGTNTLQGAQGATPGALVSFFSFLYFFPSLRSPSSISFFFYPA